MTGGGHGAPTRRRAPLGVLVVAVVVAVLAVFTGGRAIATTSAAWTDRTYTTAAVSAGTWSTPATCTAMTMWGTPVGTCKVTAMTYEGWGSPGNHTRNVYLTFQVSSPYLTWYIVFDADLSAATGRDTGTGTWNWATASTRPSSNLTVTSACADLPDVTGRTASGWNWAGSPQIFFPITDDPTVRRGDRSCR